MLRVGALRALAVARVGVVGPKRATAREPDTALAALKTGKILLTHATPNTGGAVDHLIVPEV